LHGGSENTGFPDATLPNAIKTSVLSYVLYYFYALISYDILTGAGGNRYVQVHILVGEIWGNQIQKKIKGRERKTAALLK
jgi:hypothetical protein